jgi:hypothetical protein
MALVLIPGRLRPFSHVDGGLEMSDSPAAGVKGGGMMRRPFPEVTSLQDDSGLNFLVKTNFIILQNLS